MKMSIKMELMAKVLHAIPLMESNVTIPENQKLLDELNHNHPLFDHWGSRLDEGECLVIFYDDYSSQTPHVVQAFLGLFEFIGHTFENAQSYGYKFTKLFEVDVFNKDIAFDDYEFGSIPMFYRFKQPKKLFSGKATNFGDPNKSKNIE